QLKPDSGVWARCERLTDLKPGRLYALWRTWREQQPHLPDEATRAVVVHIMLCKLLRLDGFSELVRRTRHRHVFQALLETDLTMQSHSSKVEFGHHKQLLRAMDRNLQRTIKKQLIWLKHETPGQDLSEEAQRVKDRELDALIGASEMREAIRRW